MPSALARRVISSPISGAIGWIASVAWDAFWLIGPPIGIDAQSRRIYLLWGGAATVICTVQAFLTLWRSRVRLQRQLQQAEEHIVLVKNRQAVLDKIEGLVKDGTAYLRFAGGGEPISAFVGQVSIWEKTIAHFLVTELGRDESGRFHLAHAVASSHLRQGSDRERTELVVCLQGELDYLIGLNQRLATL